MVSDFNTAFNIEQADEEFPRFIDRDLETVEILEIVVEILQKTSHQLLKAIEAKNTNVTLLRSHLMIEELAEVLASIAEGDMVSCLHELADLRYVCDGTAICFGLDNKLERAVSEVHKANLSKLDGAGKPIISAAGRVVKSENFVAVDVNHLFSKEN